MKKFLNSLLHIVKKLKIILKKIFSICEDVFFKILRSVFLVYVFIGKKFRKLNKIGKSIFIIFVILFLYLFYYLFLSHSLYGTYTISEINTNKISNSNKIKIEKNKISGSICGDWYGELKEVKKIISSQVISSNSTCDTNTLSLQYSIMYGLQSGLQYSFKSGDLILFDTARNNTFVLKKS